MGSRQRLILLPRLTIAPNRIFINLTLPASMRRLTRRAFLATSSMATAAVAIAQGCTPSSSTSNNANSSSSNGSSQKVLRLYSGRHYDSDKAVYEGFERKTGIKIEYISDDADKLIERIQAEGSHSAADLLLTVDAGRLWRASAEGLLQSVTATQSPNLYSAVPENLRHPEGQWFALSKRARVIMYNKEKVQPSELSTYEALADARWRSQILVRTSSNIYNLSWVGEMIAVHGEAKTEQWARSMVANFARPPEGNDTAQIMSCAAGIGSIAISNTYYLVRLAKSTKPEERTAFQRIGVCFPNQGDRGTHINISGVGLVKNARNPEGAIQFMEYLLSREAQELFAKGNNEYPVLKGVALDPELAKLGTFKESTVSATTFGRNNEVALKLLDRAGWK